jgi:curved DNA-binding protein CbpA
MAIERDAYEVLQVHPRAHPRVVEAAYLVLASIYDPGGGEAQASQQRMAELEEAYASVRTAERRALYDQQRKRHEVMEAALATPYHPFAVGSSPAGGDTASGVLDFGRYEGWTIAQLAQHDPDYLRWLSRHSSGIRYRRQIDEALRKGSHPAGQAPGRRGEY